MPQALPVVEELTPAPEPDAVFMRLAGRPHCLFLDSAMQDPVLGRYSFLTADPFDYLKCSAGQSDQSPLSLFGRGAGGEGAHPLALLTERLARFPANAVAGLPPFQGGAAGLLSYELGRHLEKLPRPAYDEFQVQIGRAHV